MMMMLVASITFFIQIDNLTAESRNIIYVDDDGTADYTSIQDAIDNANPGDTVFVYNGTYYEHVNIIKDGISLIGENKDNTIIQGSSTINTVSIENTNNVTVKSFSIYDGDYDVVHITGSYNITIDGCYIDAKGHAKDGIGTHSNSEYIILSNNIVRDGDAQGIRLSDTHYSTIFNNNVKYADVNQIQIVTTCSYNTFYGNYLDGTTGSRALDLRVCFVGTGNLFYHNTFIGTVASRGVQTSIWNLSYPSGGNYYSYYSGNDNYYGPDQNIPGSDGIGDTPYSISGGEEDLYPYMNQDGWIEEEEYDIYVDDDKDPSWYDAIHLKTIQEGINNATTGDTIFVFNGTYYENVEILKDEIKLFGENKYDTIIDAQNLGDGIFVGIKSHKMEIRNFTIKNADGCGILFKDPASPTDVQNNIISDCIIFNSSTNSDYWSGVGIRLGGHDAQMLGNKIINCEIYNNDACGIRITRTAYANVENNKIIGCKIHNNGLNGWWAGPESRAGIAINQHSTQINNTVISDCEIYQNYGDGIFHENYGYNFYIYNNKIYDNNRYGINITGTSNSLYIYHNNFYDNLENAYDIGINNWDNGSLSGGNYWSDFDEPGEGAWDNNSDCIVDSPYDNIKGGNNQDYYPLMYPYGETAPDFNMTLYPGWNLIGWPYDYDTTASILSENITGCLSVSCWNATMQTYDTYIVGGPPSFDFSISCGMGLFVDVNQTSIWHGEG